MPIAVRDHLGLVPGTAVEFLVREGEAILRKGGGDNDPIDRVYGRLELRAPVDELLDAMRGPRPTGSRKARPGRSPRRRRAPRR